MLEDADQLNEIWSRPMDRPTVLPKEAKQSKHKPKEKTRLELLNDCIGILAGLDHQLGNATHQVDLLDRVAYLLKFGYFDLSPDDLKTLENLALWTERTRKIIGGFRAKIDAMKQSLFEPARKEGDRARHGS